MKNIKFLSFHFSPKISSRGSSLPFPLSTHLVNFFCLSHIADHREQTSTFANPLEPSAGPSALIMQNKIGIFWPPSPSCHNLTFLAVLLGRPEKYGTSEIVSQSVNIFIQNYTLAQGILDKSHTPGPLLWNGWGQLETGCQCMGTFNNIINRQGDFTLQIFPYHLSLKLLKPWDYASTENHNAIAAVLLWSYMAKTVVFWHQFQHCHNHMANVVPWKICCPTLPAVAQVQHNLSYALVIYNTYAALLSLSNIDQPMLLWCLSSFVTLAVKTMHILVGMLSQICIHQNWSQHVQYWLSPHVFSSTHVISELCSRST